MLSLGLSCYVLVFCALFQRYVSTRATEASVSSEPVVVTPLGRIRGSWMTSRRGRRFEAYRGMRYAEPPVGELRFQAPRPILRYWGEVDAREDGPACPMPEQMGAQYQLDEDCLRVNVYTPQSNSSDVRPVVVYIHTGGFYMFSGRSDTFGPGYLLDRDLVLVTINYRLASLGFLSTGDRLAPGNNGMKDQVAALRWVQNTIKYFGGDPKLVTIVGCSAGAASVTLHMISPMSEGLFQRAVSISGSPISSGATPTDQRALAVKQAQLVGCPTNSSEAIIHCLKTKPWKDIANTLNSFFEFGEDPLILWGPVVETDYGQEQFIAQQPTDAIREGRIHAVPFIVSQTNDEFFWKAFAVLSNSTLLTTMNNDWDRVAPIAFILPNQASERSINCLKQFYFDDQKIKNDTRSAKKLGRLYADAIIGFPVHRLANLMCRYSSAPVYYYRFSYMGNNSYWEDPVTGKPKGVAHQDDLVYLFTSSSRFPEIPLSSPDSIIVDRMTALLYNFAKHGDPNPRGDLPELVNLSWPQMKPVDRKYLRIGEEFSVERKLGEDRYRMWDKLYPLPKQNWD